MPRTSSRQTRRTPASLIVMSVLVIGSLTISAIVSLAGPQLEPTPTEPIAVTIIVPSVTTPTPTQTDTPPAPAIGPAVAPTQ